MGLGQSFIESKQLIAVLLALGGFGALYVGFRVFAGKAGVTRDGTIVKWGKQLHVRVGTAGIGVMLTACVWGAAAAYVTPKTLETKGGDVKLSLLQDIPAGQPFLVSTSTGDASKYLECKRESKDLVCFNIAPGAQCGPPPAFVNGLARLQVAAVLRAGPGSDATAANQDRQIRQVLAERGSKDWGLHVMNYVGRENGQPIRRIVFNGVAVDLEKPMCAWLRCEGWTFGPCQALPNLRDDIEPDDNDTPKPEEQKKEPGGGLPPGGGS